MFSLYIHIPFCDKKCGYCSFQVIPTENTNGMDAIISTYVDSVCKQLNDRANVIAGQQVKTIYFGGGTPARIGTENLMRIIDHIIEKYDIDNCMELGIEINPYPPEEMLHCIKTINKTYKQFPRIRRSVWIQTFDNAILHESGRQYTFPWIVDFLRNLVPTKYDTTAYNFDFIAFGKFSTNKKGEKILWDDTRFNFFQDFVNSGFADSFSLYTLELFPGSIRYEQQRKKFWHANEGFGLKKYGSDDDVYDEFQLLKSIILDGGYNRYEISNFSSAGKNSIHNRVYRNRENYIGIGTSAASFWNLTNEDQSFVQSMSDFFHQYIDIGESKGKIFFAPTAPTWIRRTNTRNITDYSKHLFIDPTTIDILKEEDALIEEIFLWLRTDTGVRDFSKHASVLASDRNQQIENYKQLWLVVFEEDRLILTDEWMDKSNTIISSLLNDI